MLRALMETHNYCKIKDMETKKEIETIIKTLRVQAKDNLAMADYLESLTFTEAPKEKKEK